jgi:DNA uptake protein ComE-like DNA-binding protein
MIRRTPDRATVLVTVLVIIALGTTLVAALLFRSRAELGAAAASQRSQQAYLAAMSGIHRAMQAARAAPYNPGVWLDNEDMFRAQPVGGEDADWAFTVYAPQRDNATGVRYGLIDQSGLVNLNVATPQMLSGVPGLNEEQIDALLDWRDRDDIPRPNGAEINYYASIQPVGYRCKNGPLLTLEELLLVRGFSAETLYGEDANLNGLLDPNEADGQDRFPADNGDSEMTPGLIRWATVISYETDRTREDQPRVNINGGEDELAALSDSDLPPKTIQFIELYRAEGGVFRHPSDLLNMQYVLREDHPEAGLLRGSVISSGVGAGVLATVMDALTTRPGGSGMYLGLININTAPQEVLATLEAVDDNLAQRIVAHRSSLEPPHNETVAWLFSEGLVDVAEFKGLAPEITTRSNQYRVRSIGYNRQTGQYRVLEALIDLVPEGGRIFYLRDLTRLGVPIHVTDPSSSRSAT